MPLARSSQPSSLPSFTDKGPLLAAQWGHPALPPGNGEAIKCGQCCCQTHKMAAPGQTLLDELPLLPRLLLRELYLLEQSIQVHFSLLVESVSSPGLAVFVEGWLIKAGMPWRKVRLGPATALPSGPCALPDLGSAFWPLPARGRERNPRPQREAAVVDGTQLRRKRWRSGTRGLREVGSESEPRAEGNVDDWLGDPRWETQEMEMSRQSSSMVGAGERR